MSEETTVLASGWPDDQVVAPSAGRERGHDRLEVYGYDYFAEGDVRRDDRVG